MRIHLERVLVHPTDCLPFIGRLCKVYCLADGCDHPALCRVCGFADHSHLTRFCPRCKVHRIDLCSIDGLTGGEFSLNISAH